MENFKKNLKKNKTIEKNYTIKQAKHRANSTIKKFNKKVGQLQKTDKKL